MGRCIRILLHLNTDRAQHEMVHVYLRDAKRLRPDVSSAQ
ncbi:MAG TPA: chorismate mutase [Planctomycetaceae bacterium]|nr:chorismate mutase [Planctomycetaceae bacterium]